MVSPRSGGLPTFSGHQGARHAALQAVPRHELSNGLLLRTDFHRLFDEGLVTVEPDLSIRVSPRIRESYFNGKAYYRLDGQRLRAPSRPEWRPDPDKLRWHNVERFQR